MRRDRLATGGAFHDDAFMADLDVRFAGFWFDAYDARGRKPTPWSPLFEMRSHRGVLPIQFALAGMNAHIEHDLPMAVVNTCLARGGTPDNPHVHADFDKVNDLLATVEADIRQSFLTELEKTVNDHVEPIAHLVASWDITKARDFAWLTAQTLWELRSVRPLFDAHSAMLAHTVGMGSRLLLTPLAL
jgi:hypothetical protein